MARSPRGDGSGWRRRGNRDPCPSLVPAKAASAQLVVDSSAGPHRSIASPGVATLVLLQVDIVFIHPVTGPGANQSVTGSGVCRMATAEVRPHEYVAGSRSPCCPSSAFSSPGRAGGRGVVRGRALSASNHAVSCFNASNPVHMSSLTIGCFNVSKHVDVFRLSTSATHARPFLPLLAGDCPIDSLASGFWFWSFNPSKIAPSRRPAASATGDTPPGQSSLPVPPTPCVCLAFSLAVASTTSPPVPPGSSDTLPR